MSAYEAIVEIHYLNGASKVTSVKSYSQTVDDLMKDKTIDWFKMTDIRGVAEYFQVYEEPEKKPAVRKRIATVLTNKYQKGGTLSVQYSVDADVVNAWHAMRRLLDRFGQIQILQDHQGKWTISTGFEGSLPLVEPEGGSLENQMKQAAERWK